MYLQERLASWWGCRKWLRILSESLRFGMNIYAITWKKVSYVIDFRP
jgi:hypothetical protein